MHISSNLSTSRHGVYYFRFSLPKSLHPKRQRSSIRLSLGTRCPRQALQLSRILCYAAERIMAQPETRQMEYQQIRHILTEHFKAMLERRGEKLMRYGRLEPTDISALINSRDFASQALNDKDYSIVGSDAEIARFAKKYSLSLQPGTAAHETFRQELLRALRDYCTHVLQLDAKLENYELVKPHNAPIHPIPKERRLADVIEEYHAEKLRLKEWRIASARGFRAQLEQLLNIVGRDASLHLELEAARNVKATLLRLPKNIANKPAYRGKTVTELLEMEIPQQDLPSPVNVSKYISTYSTFYAWAVKNKLTPEDHFKILIDDTSKVAMVREAYTLEEAQRIFAVVMQAKKTHQKWGVLLAFYTGARLNEIAQLQTGDIQQINNIWCINIADDSEGKQLKNASSRRIIPIHSRLIDLGFLKFVKSVGANKRLFQALSSHPGNGYGRNLGRWFNNSLLRKQLGITSRALVFHSIRHTVARQLRNARVSDATIKQILGHSQEGVLLNVYAPTLDVAILQEAIEKVGYYSPSEAHTAAT